MKRSLGIVCVLLILASIPWGPCRAEWTIWHSPLVFAEGDPALTIVPTGAQYQAIKVTSSAPAQNRMISLGFVLPSDVVIDGVTVCYENANTQNYISGIRLTRMQEPNSMVVLHDDQTLQNVIGPHCYRTNVNSSPVAGTITLTLDLDYFQTNGYLTIGAIGVHVSSPLSGINDGTQAAPPSDLLLRPSGPNPSGDPMQLEYTIERGGRVDLKICDVTGRILRTLYTGDVPAGDHRLTWDLRDDQGREVPSGAYYYRAFMDGRVASRGVVVIR